MSRTECLGARSWVWSLFHRSIPHPARMIDLDYIECCPYCWDVLLLGEIAKDIGQEYKATYILRNIACKLGITGICIFVREQPVQRIVAEVLGVNVGIPTPNERQLRLIWQKLCASPDKVLRIKVVYPLNKPGVTLLSASEYGAWLSRVHHKHELSCTKVVRSRRLFEPPVSRNDDVVTRKAQSVETERDARPTSPSVSAVRESGTVRSETRR